MVHISNDEALLRLYADDAKFLGLFKHGTMSMEIFKPEVKDTQEPHDQDEIYIIVNGKSEFYCAGKSKKVSAGDFLFVPAGKEHRFTDFSEDFSTWVIFYGPIGGEKNK